MVYGRYVSRANQRIHRLAKPISRKELRETLISFSPAIDRVEPYPPDKNSHPAVRALLLGINRHGIVITHASGIRRPTAVSLGGPPPHSDQIRLEQPLPDHVRALITYLVKKAVKACTSS